MKMPASTVDVVGAALKASLSKNEESSNLDAQLAGSTKKALLSNTEYEPAESYQSSVLDVLKSKYIVLKSPQSQQNPTPPEQETRSDDTLKLAKQELYPLDKIQLGWSSTGDWSVGAGMVNMGNTCYLNSTLQALFHVPSLVNWLMSDKEHALKCQDNGTCIICAMRKTLQESQQRNISSIRPILIYNKLRLVCRNLIPGRQEDAHEFLRYLVEAMEKSFLQRFKNNNMFDSKVKETTPLNQILGGYLRSAVRCLRCGHVSTTFQHFQDLLLDVRKAQTLEEALELYFSREKLDDESYHCEACQKKVPATKQFQLERAPMVLCIQLKRFSVSNNKITKHIAFRQRLDLSHYARQKPNVPLVYRLVALVTHMGPTVSCGHYTAVAQAPSGNFYQFDDSMVRPISHQTVFNTNAYIMLYELEPSSLVPKQSVQASQRSKASSTITEPRPSITKSPLISPSTPSTSRTAEKMVPSSPESLPSPKSGAPVTPKLPLGVGFTSEKVYGPELPPSRNTGNVSSSNGKTAKVVSSSSSISPKLTDESSTESSEEEESSKPTPTPSSPPTKEADSSTVVEDDPLRIDHHTSPEASPTASSVVSTSVSSMSSPEVLISRKNNSPSKSLVPYETGDTSGSEDSNHSDTNNRVTTKATFGDWQVTSSTDVATTQKEVETPKSLQWDKKKIDSGNVVNELFKMSTSGYSAPVSTWNGTRSQLDKEVNEEKRMERKRSLADSSVDQGRTKHPKVNSNYNKSKSNPGYNPVQVGIPQYEKLEQQ
ncbi:ubiquitin carboxyl-terminal hydrolase 36 isoform X2 [Anthonomus grandis grandis]|uniref:ubiquitin carboxyl-terminal hydrolase 36 isoform X2 n=1 Tax=Anthonomus grandis grandis TaxID=2921223 RepID=UPI00216662AF|nr:ubiquitin carboxyl-terminal hydrolase 36 isoform X2 [Anthonomus grandis grandis]